MMFENAWWILPLVALLTAGLCLALIPLARRTGWRDHPGERRVHDSATPLTGGPAMLIAFGVLLAASLPQNHFLQGLAAGSLLLFLTGFIDDRRHIPAPVRFLLQIVACAIMITWADVRLDDFGRLFTPSVLSLGWLSVPITLFSALGVINAFNLIDGMDGLGGSIFLVAAGGMALSAALAGQHQMLSLLLVLMAGVLGFLLLNARFPWNPTARLFMGNSGSMMLGFILAWCFIALGNDHNEAGQRAFMPMTAVWLFAVPLLDTTTQIWRRWRAGLSPFDADQKHLHHAFLRAGYSTGEAWVSITLVAAVLGAFGLLLDVSGLPEYWSFWIFLAFAFAYYFYIRRSWQKQRFLGRNFVYNDAQP
jgi:UDP-GlcNAc:undecaprenyl-phosphate GlcNAc-1-phosphate transferase